MGWRVTDGPPQTYRGNVLDHTSLYSQKGAEGHCPAYHLSADGNTRDINNPPSGQQKAPVVHGLILSLFLSSDSSEMRSCSPRLASNLHSSCLSLPSTGLTGVHHHATPHSRVLNSLFLELEKHFV